MRQILQLFIRKKEETAGKNALDENQSQNYPEGNDTIEEAKFVWTNL